MYDFTIISNLIDNFLIEITQINDNRFIIQIVNDETTLM